MEDTIRQNNVEVINTEQDEFTSELMKIQGTEIPSDDNEVFLPIVPAESASVLERQQTMRVLLEVGKILKGLEYYEEQIASLEKKIEEETKKAEAIKEQWSDGAVKIILAGTVVCAIIGAYIIPIFILGFIVGGIVGLIGLCMLIGKIDTQTHKEENERKAKQYRIEHVNPLRAQLAEMNGSYEALLNGERVGWALDVVGQDMFDIECVKQLYILLKTRRADNLKEALNKYDDIMYKTRMENMQYATQKAAEISASESIKQTEKLEKIEKSSKEAADMAKANAAINLKNVQLQQENNAINRSKARALKRISNKL